jgi:hypothetical protein
MCKSYVLNVLKGVISAVYRLTVRIRGYVLSADVFPI